MEQDQSLVTHQRLLRRLCGLPFHPGRPIFLHFTSPRCPNSCAATTGKNFPRGSRALEDFWRISPAGSSTQGQAGRNCQARLGRGLLRACMCPLQAGTGLCSHIPPACRPHPRQLQRHPPARSGREPGRDGEREGWGEGGMGREGRDGEMQPGSFARRGTRSTGHPARRTRAAPGAMGSPSAGACGQF